MPRRLPLIGRDHRAPLELHRGAWRGSQGDRPIDRESGGRVLSRGELDRRARGRHRDRAAEGDRRDAGARRVDTAFGCDYEGRGASWPTMRAIAMRSSRIRAGGRQASHNSGTGRGHKCPHPRGATNRPRHSTSCCLFGGSTGMPRWSCGRSLVALRRRLSPGLPLSQPLRRGERSCRCDQFDGLPQCRPCPVRTVGAFTPPNTTPPPPTAPTARNVATH